MVMSALLYRRFALMESVIACNSESFVRCIVWANAYVASFALARSCGMIDPSWVRRAGSRVQIFKTLPAFSLLSPLA